MSFVINLHNDLLGCVASNEHSVDFTSRSTKCSLPQLIEGHIKLDVLAIATLTQANSVQKAKRQLELYQLLLKKHRDQISSDTSLDSKNQKVHFLLAIENASGLVTEEEPLSLAFKRLKEIQKIQNPLYISFTWNQENRFGGGNVSDVGLKVEGKELLRHFNGTSTAIDLSHTCDALAYDLINQIDKEALNIPLIASHSNARAIHNVKRNLPDELILEIKKRGGLIGFNFVRHFIGRKAKDSIRHLEHLLELGCENHIAFGADFFGGFEIPSHLSATPLNQNYFFDEYSSSSCIPRFLEDLSRSISIEAIEKIAYKNALKYLERHQFLLENKSNQL